MNKRLNFLISIPYFIFTIVVIFSRVFKYPELENLFRPTLMLLLIVWYSFGSSIQKTKVSWFFIIALIFSMLGDIFRMPLFDNFILGLAFFLFSHVLYSILFLWESRGQILRKFNDNWLFMLIMFLILASVLISLLPPLIIKNQSVFLIAMPSLIIALYLLVISSNVYSSVNNTIYGNYVMLGGLFFIFSDSVLAINRFSIDVRLSSVWVLSSYVIAQWFIVYGYMNSKRNPNSGISA